MKTKTILASLVLAVSVAAVALTAWVNRPTDSFFEANLEALTKIEEDGSSVMCTQTRTPGNYYMKRCGDCAGPDRYAMDIIAFCGI